jgi:hypothetical protein
MIVIPFKEFPSFTEEITLDNVPYRLSFNWNTRGEFFSLIFQSREEENLAAIKLVLEYELISNYPDYGLPPGKLYVVDTTDSTDNIGRDDFTNNRALQLIYVPEDEVEEAI